MSVTIIKLGLGETVSNWGTHNGIPSVFIEPAVNHSGEVGRELRKDEQTHILPTSICDGGTIIEIHDMKGAEILIEDMRRAVWDWQEKHSEPLKCGDCMLIHGKSVCTMNCGPLVKQP
jgi:hypothetical protein